MDYDMAPLSMEFFGKATGEIHFLLQDKGKIQNRVICSASPIDKDMCYKKNR